MARITAQDMQALDDAMALRDWARIEADKLDKTPEWALGLFSVVSFMVARGASLETAKFLASSQAKREG